MAAAMAPPVADSRPGGQVKGHDGVMVALWVLLLGWPYAIVPLQLTAAHSLAIAGMGILFGLGRALPVLGALGLFFAYVYARSDAGDCGG